MVAAFRASETSILGYHDEPPFTRNYILNTPAVGTHCASLMEQFDVRPRLPGLLSSNFSGGNQQKLVLAREMARNPKVLLVGQPTRGVDIGAIEFIHRELVKSRDAGCAVLVVSVELEEILSLADRILVMFAGKIVGEVEPGHADESKLGLMMAGAKPAPSDVEGAA
jgi:simple sugar transport system ATP-binding protein